MIYFSTTTNKESLEKDARYVWKMWRNKCIAVQNATISPIKSPIEWNQGVCFFCGGEVDKTATGCSKCHYSFLD